jgi:hypothetical protein
METSFELVHRDHMIMPLLPHTTCVPRLSSFGLSKLPSCYRGHVRHQIILDLAYFCSPILSCFFQESKIIDNMAMVGH